MKPCSDSRLCYGCGACTAVCEQGCIRLVRDAEGFDYPEVDEDACTQCGACRAVCGAGMKVLPQASVPTVYAAWHTSPQVRAKGTSGGVFAALAETLLEQGGAVVGAAFSSDFRSVSHVVTHSRDGLEALQGSKYIQSSTLSALRQTLELLRAGKKVLFSGTPCQTHAVRQLAGPLASRLVTCDLLCHGVASPGVFGAYLRELELERGSEVVGYSFRDKRLGWNFSRVSVAFANGCRLSLLPSSDRFMNGFYANVLLRPSCYACPFAGPERASDLTIADCWRVAATHPHYDDNRGTSLILANTAAGGELVAGAVGASRLFVGPYDFGLACRNNAPLQAPAREPAGRPLFFERFRASHSFRDASRTYVRELLVFRKRCMRWVKYLFWPVLRRFQ